MSNLLISCFLNFCKQFERLYGKGACTPNMHLHMHLKACLLDYGPPHGFWCYPFERYNGILGQYHTNRRAIESQLLKKFCHSQAFVNGNISTSEFGGFLPTKNIKQRECPRYNDDGDVNYNHFHMRSSPISLINSFALDNKSVIKPLKPFKIKALSSEKVRQLQEIFTLQDQLLTCPISIMNMEGFQLMKISLALTCQVLIAIHQLQ